MQVDYHIDDSLIRYLLDEIYYVRAEMGDLLPELEKLFDNIEQAAEK